MKVIVTQEADDNRFAIYLYHLGYSEDHANRFEYDLDQYLELLAENPLMGHVYNEEKGIYRAIFRKKHNIYYLIRDEALYIIYVLDGQLDFNTVLESEDAPVPPLRKRFDV